jgi:hypothetical protein
MRVLAPIVLVLLLGGSDVRSQSYTLNQLLERVEAHPEIVMAVAAEDAARNKIPMRSSSAKVKDRDAFAFSVLSVIAVVIHFNRSRQNRAEVHSTMKLELKVACQGLLCLQEQG